MTLSAIGTLTLALLGAWVFGGIALRLAGAVIALAGLLGLSLRGDPNGLVVLALGACLWLAGQLHFRMRHGYFRSALAEWLSIGAAWAGRRGLMAVTRSHGDGEVRRPHGRTSD